jgi:hypothetical protein
MILLQSKQLEQTKQSHGAGQVAGFIRVKKKRYANGASAEEYAPDWIARDNDGRR